MICLNRKFYYLECVVTICFVLVLFVLLIVSPEQSYWFANVFHDKSFLFIWIPLFLFGDHIIDNSISGVQIIRMNNRKEAMTFMILQKVLHAFVLITVWYIFIMIISMISYGNVSTMTLQEILGLYVKYLVGMVLLSNLVILFRRLLSKKTREIAYILVYCFAVVEITAIAELNILIPGRIYFCFSWIFSVYDFAIYILIAIDIILIAMNVQISSKKDYL